MSLPPELAIPSTQKARMLAGELYHAMDPELHAERLRCHGLLHQLNGTVAPDLRQALFQQLLGSSSGEVGIRSPFFCDYGSNIHLGPGVFLNFNCVLLDVCTIHIGDDTQIGPGVQILTADHPRDPAIRAAGLESGKPIRVGRNVWIGGGALLLPGITVGDDSIIGAGAVVTRDVPPGATVVGNPARQLQPRPTHP